jgi:hypothetical protein
MSAPALQVRATAAVTARQPNKSTWRLTPAGVGFLLMGILLYAGWHLQTERYITPQRGLGYALGIVGGSLMLLLFMYSARKHFRWLAFLGPTVGWFRFHMLLGVAGPLCILYHSNFHLGATNSNVALISMLTVAGSGIIGRYIYSRIHHGLYGSKATLGELRAGSDNLHTVSGSVAFVPELVEKLESAERRMLAAGPRLPVLGLVKPIAVAALAIHARWSLRRYVSRALRAAARNSAVIAGQRRRLRRTALAYINRRLAATRRLADFQVFERLFSLWHALHIPLIAMLLLAGIVHVVVVHLY